MMNLQQEIVNSLYYTCNQIEYKGRDVFKALYENTPMVYENIRQDKGDCKGLKDAISGKNRFRIEDLRAESSLNFDYSPYNEASQVSYLDHYFRHLYRIIKFVDTTNLISNTGSDNFKTRYLYTSMVRATFSRYEFVMLYYNGLSNYGVDKFKPLIEKYALLRGLRLEMLAMEEETKYYQGLSEADIKESTHLYRRSAFGVIPE